MTYRSPFTLRSCECPLDSAKTRVVYIAHLRFLCAHEYIGRMTPRQLSQLIDGYEKDIEEKLKENGVKAEVSITSPKTVHSGVAGEVPDENTALLYSTRTKE